MNRGVYAASAGMIGLQNWLDIASNNLANVSTNGFKQDGVTFKDAMEQQLQSAGGLGPSIGTFGSGPTPNTNFTDFQVGPIKPTSDPLDLAIKSANAMFAVQTPAGVKFTRDGSFQLDQNRQLVTQDGYPVLSAQMRPITVPEGAASFDPNGKLSVVSGAQAPQDVDQVGLFGGAFTKFGANLFNGANTQQDSSAEVVPSALEGSNVNPVSAMVDLITIGRTYDMMQKTITSQDQATQKLTQAM